MEKRYFINSDIEVTSYVFKEWYRMHSKRGIDMPLSRVLKKKNYRSVISTGYAFSIVEGK